MTPIDVRLEDVGKQYRLGTRRGSDTFWALRGLTLDVRRGEAFGIIGRNGAGKSTLLKLLAGITAPSRGRITIDGRLSALIEVGSGFHPELTGRENVYLSGAILGMSRREIADKLPRIVDFAGVTAFIDTPVKWYSSGMYVRLGFSVAAHLDPDILLIDEVLAVGDAEFQVKCLERVEALKRRGVTILLISHDLSAVERLCDRVLLLEKGEAACLGDAAEVIGEYHQRTTTAAVQSDEYAPIAREGAVKVVGLRVSASGGGVPQAGAPLVVTVRYRARRALEVECELSYFSADGRTLIASATAGGGDDRVLAVAAPGGEVEFRCPVWPLGEGSYYLRAVMRERGSRHVIDWWDGGTMLHLAPSGKLSSAATLVLPHEWQVHHAHQPPAVNVR